MCGFYLFEFISAQQSCNWYAHLNGPLNDYVHKIRPLNNQHLLIGGSVENTAKIDTTTYFNCNLPSGFITEFDNQKNVIFTKTFLNITAPVDPNYFQTTALCKDVMKDSNGNYYVAINFIGTLKIDSLQWNAENGLLIVKLNTNGKLLWHYFLEKAVPTSICFDSNNDLVLLAYSPIEMYYTPASLLLLKLNPNNGAVKKYLIGNNAFSDIKTGEMIFKNNNFYITCSFADSIDFSNHQKIISNKNSCTVLKLDTNWNIQKYTIFTGQDTRTNIINDFKIDANDNIFVIGTYSSLNFYINDTIRLTKPTIASRMFLTKLNSNFQHLWTKQEVQNPANSNNYGIREGYKLAVDPFNNLYALGYVYYSVILGIDTFANNSLIMIKYDNNGQYQLSEKIAGISGKYYDLEYANNHLFLSAPFSSSVSVCQTTISSSGLNDSYVLEIDKLTDVFVAKKFEYSLDIFPNPADNYVHIHSTNFQNSFTQFSLFDITGKLIRSGNIEKSTIPLSQEKEGMYILQLKNDKQTVHQKLIIQH